MALTAENIKCAIVMICRANCTGAEAADVAETLRALNEEYVVLSGPFPTAPAQEDENGDEPRPD